ncbi:LytTR family transcriptional regulator DNA-binding domain-containing protein [Parapedobacter deserti]|uniref:LytTR family transcriptional regulator DNA-binding domain-containing protein n=1 Tax=Parapedobacter deserti TaxID=1912957 RepID=A0ABV7JS75_9SPHI
MQTHELTYFSARGQVATALAVAVVIVLNNQRIPFIEIIKYPGFYVSVAFSWLFAWMIIHFIAWFSRSIDRFPRWNRSHDVRFFMQIGGGVVLPCLAAIALAFGFLQGFGRDFMASGYLTHEFPIICLLIVIMNLTYLVLHYRNEADRLAEELNDSTVSLRKAVIRGDIWKRRALVLRQKLEIAGNDAAGISRRLSEAESVLAALETELLASKDELGNLPEKPKLHGVLEMQGALGMEKVPFSKIRYLEYDNRKVWAYTTKSPRSLIASLLTLQEALPDYWFFRIRRTIIINRMYIVNGPGIKRKRGLEVTIRLAENTTKTFTLHRKNAAAYLEWFSMPHE